LNRGELGWLAERLLQEQNHIIVDKLSSLAADLGTSLPKVGVAWCLKNPNVSTVILGATKPQQLQETLQATEVVPLLTPEIMEQIERILNNKPQHPPY
jgi:aryl-alcohol dehydrogenase-like predicted oxidoreductase